MNEDKTVNGFHLMCEPSYWITSIHCYKNLFTWKHIKLKKNCMFIFLAEYFYNNISNTPFFKLIDFQKKLT